jgi:hypothetical protein
MPLDAGAGPAGNGPADVDGRLPADAMLFIHANDAPAASGVAGWLQQLKAQYLHPAAPQVVPMLDLQVQDQRGRIVHHIVPALTVHRLSLPAGSYLVTARLGNTRRGYYVNLAPGSEFDLFLSFDQAA